LARIIRAAPRQSRNKPKDALVSGNPPNPNPNLNLNLCFLSFIRRD
jgi:hypothetical protein